MRKQMEILEDIQAKGHNIVTCGHCGSVILHDMKLPEDENGTPIITCPICKFESEPCDFPDLFYDGWEDGAGIEKE